MPEKIAYESPGRWVQVIETPNKFYFLRRKNRDSVAVFLVRKSSGIEPWEVLVRMQPLPIHNTEPGEPMILFSCPITGGLESLDEDPRTCAMREALEEAGYRTDPQLLGRYIVGTQTDEFVHMFWQDVSGIEPELATQDGTIFEAASENKWMPLSHLLQDEAYAANQIGYLRLCRALKYNDQLPQQ